MSISPGQQRSTTTPRSLYVHVPFCRHRCGYCNFTLVANRDDWIDRYIEATRLEIEMLFNDFCLGPTVLDTLFFGGGTPSHLSDQQFDRLMKIVLARFQINSNTEISLEANPADVDQAKVKYLSGIGFNRVSLGVQSFNDDKLIFLERDHTGHMAHSAVEICKKHFDSVSLDLIFGAPKETRRAWQKDLHHALELAPDHVSTYGLTIEKGTTFWSRREKRQFDSLSSDDEADLFALAIQTLDSHGILQYEISNFAAPGHRCRHNEVYWTGAPFFAIGPGAASFVDGVRRINHQSVSTYLKKIESGANAVASEERLNAIDAAKERFVFGLRRLDGISPAEFIDATGFSVDEVAGPAILKLIRYELLDRTSERIRLTARGVMLFDSVAVELQ